MSRRPNVLLITTDQHRADCLGCYGNPVIQTPNLDRLAAQGVRCSHAYVQNPLCMPQRATLLTGMYVRSHGVWVNGVALDPAVPTLAELLGRAGYETRLFGKGHLTPFGGEPRPSHKDSVALWRETDLSGWNGPYYGFEQVKLVLGHVLPDVGHYGIWLRERHPQAVEKLNVRNMDPGPTGAPQSFISRVPEEAHHSTWLGDITTEFLQGDHDRPFFLWVSFPDPHHPFSPPEKYAAMYDPAGVVMPVRREGELADKPPQHLQYYHGGYRHEGAGIDNPGAITDEQLREIIARTYGMITLVDVNVGRILRALEDSGLAQDTVVVFMSDHGELLGDHHLALKGPFHYEGLLRVPMLWRYPKGLPAGGVVDGLIETIDWVATALELTGVERPDWVQGESMRGALAGQGTTCRDSVLTENHSAYHPELNLKTLRTERYKLTYYAGRPFGELYDLETDPNEFVNLYDFASFRGVRDELRLKLLDRLALSESTLGRRWSHA